MSDELDPRELLEQLRSHDTVLRQEASRHLQSISDPAALPLLADAIQDDDLSVRIAAVITLSNYELEQVQEHLEQALFDEEWEVQWAAMKGLGSIHKETALRHMGDRLPEKRVSGIQSLVKKKARHFEKAFQASLDDESDDVRKAAAWAIMKLRLYDSAEALQEQMSDASRELQAWLAEALLQLGVPIQERDEEGHPLHLQPCAECNHLLPPTQLYRLSRWNHDPILLCQFHFEEQSEKLEPFEGKFKKCKTCMTYWPKYEFVDGSCPSCREQRFMNLPQLPDDQFRCFRCQKSFPERSQSPASSPEEPICTRCAHSIAQLSGKQPFLSNRAIHFLSTAFENGHFLCEKSRYFKPLDEMAVGEDFRDECISKEYVK